VRTATVRCKSQRAAREAVSLASAAGVARVGRIVTWVAARAGKKRRRRGIAPACGTAGNFVEHGTMFAIHHTHHCGALSFALRLGKRTAAVGLAHPHHAEYVARLSTRAIIFALRLGKRTAAVGLARPHHTEYVARLSTRAILGRRGGVAFACRAAIGR